MFIHIEIYAKVNSHTHTPQISYKQTTTDGGGGGGSGVGDDGGGCDDGEYYNGL